MRGRLPAALAGPAALAVAIGLAGCAPAVPGIPGVGPIALPAPVPIPGEPGAVGEPGAPGSPDADAPSAPTAATEDGAVEFGAGPVEVDIWVDFFCPYCRAFEEATGEYLQAAWQDDDVTLRVHPIAILNRASMGTRYSTRAASAFLCVAESSPEDAYPYFRHLYAVQPPESTEGLTNDELAVGAPDAAGDCIREERFGRWVDDWTERSIDAGVRGTPTVLVDGEVYPGGYDAAELRRFIEGDTAAV